MTAQPPTTIISTTTTYCPTCRTSEPAQIFSRSGSVFMKRICPAGNIAPVKIAADESWYMERFIRSFRADRCTSTNAAQKGCPFDCGPCANHRNRLRLPVFSITNDCDLDCPICFTYNRPDLKYYKSIDEVKAIVDHLLEESETLDVINLTGGEPTLHPDFFSIIKYLRSCPINRITVNTNGLTVAHNESFAEKLSESGAQMVLSLNSFDPQKNKMIHGRDISQEKKQALSYFEKYNVPVTLLCVAIKNFNEDDISAIIAEYFPKNFVKNVVIQNMTFTGANGKNFTPREHITLDEVECFLEKAGTFSRNDFFPLGSSHPLCYSVGYFFASDGKPLSLTMIFGREKLISMTEEGYLLSGSPSLADDFMDGINRLWAEGADQETLTKLRTFFKRIYPSDGTISDIERAARAEESIKSVYIHAHMDEDTFDLGRVSRCGDLVPDESGVMIPACSYNLLYREQDERFWRA
jgi:uncharacterized radical SAM superfamily Fe-S cluster-containing enzyme